MKNESTICDSSSDSAADPELERLLADAYDVPPPPRSLLKRLDTAIEAEWGHSPQLATSRLPPLTAALSRVRVTSRAHWPQIAAGLAATVALVMVLNVQGHAYGWATMLEALAQCGIVEVQAGDETRWLSLSEGVMGQQTGQSWRLVDVRQGVVLERNAGDERVRRRRLRAAATAADPNRLALALLVGQKFSALDGENLPSLRVVDESWRSVTLDHRKQIALRVSLESPTSERFELLLKLDPKTGLPSACELPDQGQTSTALAFSYPGESIAARREQAFPAAMAVVDVDDSGRPLLAAAGEQPESAALPSPKVAATSPSEQPAALVGAFDSQPPMAGAPSKWRPVAVVDQPAREVVGQVDALLGRSWKERGITPAEPAADEELLRRAYLDLAGRTPSVNEVRTYLNDASPHRYEALVDRLLESPDHASHIATVWRTFLIPEGVDLARFGGVEAFDQWLAERLASDDPYDDVVRSLLLAEGRLSRSGPLLFYSAVKLDPEQLAARTARVFLGMRLECAQCHDHPFEPWTQHDFWSFAAFFAQISRPQAELESVSTVMRVRDVDRGDVMLPDTETIVPPKFLNADAPAELPSASRREHLARWLTSADNPYFARATANRVWGHLFGRGIVDPIDDFGTQHEAKSPELLDLLAGHFIRSKFSLRALFRTVALSRAYRLSSGAATVDPQRVEWFGQMNVKTLTAEQVYDCITVATLLDTTAVGPQGFNVPRFGNASRDEFVRQFRSPAGHRTEYLGGIPQALTLMNGSLIDSATGLSSSGLLKSLEAPFFTNRQRVEVLYLATLSRRPRASEWEWLDEHIADDAATAQQREGLADLLWALLNSAEFTLNH